jgi:ABC-type cobalamin/Fe3+-siderophores transport system ATPase subunit
MVQDLSMKQRVGLDVFITKLNYNKPMKEVIFVLGKQGVGKSTLINELYWGANKIEDNDLSRIRSEVRTAKKRMPYCTTPVQITKYVVESNKLSITDIVGVSKEFIDLGWNVKIIKL